MSYSALLREMNKRNEKEPVWRSRAYVGEFADPYVFRTGLEGGQTGPSLEWTAKVLRIACEDGVGLLSTAV